MCQACPATAVYSRKHNACIARPREIIEYNFLVLSSPSSIQTWHRPPLSTIREERTTNVYMCCENKCGTSRLNEVSVESKDRVQHDHPRSGPLEAAARASPLSTSAVVDRGLAQLFSRLPPTSSHKAGDDDADDLGPDPLAVRLSSAAAKWRHEQQPERPSPTCRTESVLVPLLW